MQRSILCIFLVFFLLSSCSDGIPKGVLSKAKMTDVLVEVHLIDGYLNTLNVDSARKVLGGYYEQTFEAFDTDSATFNKSMEFYAEDPLLMTDVYSKVNDRLVKLEKDYNRLDSIRNVIVQDSLTRVNRLIMQAQKSKDLILNVKKDSTTMDYKSFATYFLSDAGLGTLAERILYIPTPAPALTPTPAPSTQPAEAARREEVKEDTSSVKIIPTDGRRFKPVIR